MSAGIYNFSIECRADFSVTLTWSDENNNPIVLTGYSAACQVRDRSGNLLIDFSEDGSITVSQASTGATVGQITLSLPHSFTKNLTFDTGSYDLFITGPGQSKLIKGIVTLDTAETQI